MTIGIPSWVPFAGNDHSEGDDTDDDGRPPKPDPRVEERTIELPIYHVRAEYVNGDEEEFTANRISHQSSGVQLIGGEPTPSNRSVTTDGEMKESLPYETLARPLKVDEIGHWGVLYERSFGHYWCYNQWTEDSVPDVEILDADKVMDGESA